MFTARASRRQNPALWGRGSGCAFTVASTSTNPKTRKQALKIDAAGWTAAKRAEIANHADNDSWELMDRFDVPADRSLVRLIWVYKTKRSGLLKARLCIQGCA
eukprot:3147306-Pleurochrysis_carterae.AAC.1